ncbi:MAG: hypothetical protein RR696_13310 [Clostridia bacterium]
MAEPKKKRDTSKLLSALLFFTLVLSAIYSLVRMLLAPDALPDGQDYTHLKSDYLLMLIQCLLGLAVFSLPALASRKWKLEIPNFISIMYYLFLYCAIILGEVLDFYYLVPHWDTILHFFSGAMLGALGFILVEWLNASEKVRVSLSPAFISLFAFCFALSCGAIWEIYEFSCDTLLGLNMQKYATGAGEQLMGRLALKDTMKDLVIDALSAALMAVLGFVRIKTMV